MATKEGAFPEAGGSQRDQAYHRLRRLLILQQTPEGKRLREAEWAEKLGVNRTALREAFARLEAEGLIEKGPITGYFVPELSRDDILEISEVRIMLEGGAIERICRLGLNTARALKPMRLACDQLERLLEEAYYLGVAEADRRYHEALIRVAGNRRLSMLYERAPLPIIPPEIVSGTEWMVTVRRTLEEHRGIHDALVDGNKARAQELLRTHLAERFLIPLCAG
jgi:DNA-binding GntR family transcriptional regulator